VLSVVLVWLMVVLVRLMVVLLRLLWRVSCRQGNVATSWFATTAGSASVYAKLGSATSNTEKLTLAAVPTEAEALDDTGLLVALPTYSTIPGGTFDCKIYVHTGKNSDVFALGVWVAQVSE
jgi:hypothetical protein